MSIFHLFFRAYFLLFLLFFIIIFLVMSRKRLFLPKKPCILNANGIQ